MRASRLLLAVLLAGLLVPEADVASAGRAPAPRKVRVEAEPGGSILVHGEYPPTSSSCVDPTQPVLHERYRGAVEVVRGEGGSLTLLGELRFEDYLKGIAEVPRSWHMDALKAQVVAARSYAATRLDAGSGYDLCATDACQVYMGMGVERGAFGSRWARAVEETVGEVLLWDGGPAQTFYFSTSNGRTYTNQDVWGSPKLPYLERSRERDDGESPLSRWRVEVPFADLATFLRVDGRWSGGPVRSVRVRGDHIVVRGGGGRVRLSRHDVRDALNDTARCLMPGRYPTRQPGGYRLPQPVPSTWFVATVRGDTLVLRGRGWGHGIGMVQWGAKGKADRGLSYEDILAAYYGGLRPAPYDLPRRIRVLLATGLTSVSVAPAGEAKVRPRRAPEPPLRVTPRGDGLRLRTVAPPAPELEVRRVRASLEPGGRLSVRLRSEQPVRVRLELSAGGAEQITGWRSFEAGRIRLGSTLPEEITGEVRARVRITDGVDTIRVPITTVSVAEASPDPTEPAAASPPPVAGPASSRGEEPPGFPAALAGAAAALVLVLMGLLVLRVRQRRRLHRS